MSSTPDQEPATAPTVLAFHKLSPTFTWGSTNFSPRRFRALLRVFQERRYVLKADDSAGNLSHRIRITFDDGYRHLLDTLPALIDQFGIHPTVFIPTGWLGRSNSWDYSHYFRRDQHLSRGEVYELASIGVLFGSHGHSHDDLTRCSPDRLETELRDSRQCLEDILGKPVTSLSYPFGNVTGSVIAAAAAAGFKTGYTMRFPKANDPPLAQGRYAVYGFDTTFAIIQKIDHGRWYEVERLKARITNGLSGGTRLFNRIRGHV